VLARRMPTQTITYGYGRVEDFAGLAIVLIILLSALVAGMRQSTASSRFIPDLPGLMLNLTLEGSKVSRISP
jgi:divalent metal cation (Fe/Co/Zn/Cd) transporter